MTAAEEAVRAASQASVVQPEAPLPGEMPDTRGINFYDADPHLRFILRHRLSSHDLERAEPLLRSLGARIGEEIEDLAAEADRATPRLVTHDKRGERIDELAPSRAYSELERIFYCEYGLAAMSLRPGVVDPDRPSPLPLNDALIYLGEQAESGLFCPLSMTRALARTLLKFAPPDIIASYVPRLASTSLDTLYTGAMFMTEKQGGSDLGITATTAEPSVEREGMWELSGQKWFCSNVGADVILTLARPVGAVAGTRGLALFLVPRILADGRRNPYRIERVKDKLGVRSFASGEVTFERTFGHLIGGPGDGWRQMTEMLNITRLGCASAAAALARRSYLEAVVHARGRVAFGRPLAALPLMREQLLDMLLDVEAMTALFFEGSSQLAAADQGDAQAQTRVRILMPLAKFHVSDEARRVVAEGMEVRGGNAYIEDWPNARLLRDVHVQSLWEGTGNISALDVGRAIVRAHAGDALIADWRARLSAVSDAEVARAARLTLHALEDIGGALDQLGAAAEEERELLMKRLTRQLARIVSAALLVEEADTLAREDGNYRSLAQAVRYLRRYVWTPRAGFASEIDRLPLDYFDELVDWTPSVPAEASGPLLRAMETECVGSPVVGAS